MQQELAFCARLDAFCRERHLTERERDVLFEVLHGRTIDAVADRLGVSKETVKTYLRRAYARAGVSSRQEILQELDEDPARGDV